MGVTRPLWGHVRVPRDSTRMSHPLAGAHNHGGGTGGVTNYLSGRGYVAMGQHSDNREATNYTLSFIGVGNFSNRNKNDDS